MLDLLGAASQLFGDCSAEPNSIEIYLKGVLATEEQLILINQKAKEMEAEWNSQEYARLRRTEYLKLNQDELRFDDIINSTNIWVETILEIKERFPKPVVEEVL